MRKRRCFISAAYGERLSALQRVLDDFEVNWDWARSVPLNQPTLRIVLDAISRADFVIGVLDNLAPRENVLLELGMGIGLRKPVVLLRSGEAVIPSDLSDFPSFATDLEDGKLLSFQLDLFIRGLEKKGSAKRTFPFTSSKGHHLEDEPPPSRFASAIEQSVAAAITRAGGRVTVPARTGRQMTPDLLMWLPQLDPDLLNPAAIEIATRETGSEFLQQKLAEFVRSSGLRCGLIVANSISLERELRKRPPIPYIFVLSLNELRSKLEGSELSLWLKKERNRLAHGGR
jgi:hypothetical protein